jgi:hypothetical protein
MERIGISADPKATAPDVFMKALRDNGFFLDGMITVSLEDDRGMLSVRARHGRSGSL